MDADNGSPGDGLRGRLGRRRPSEPDPGNAGAGMVVRSRPARRGGAVATHGDQAVDVLVVGAGMLAPVGEASWGEGALLALSLASARAYPSFAAELERTSGRDVAYRRCGALHVALDRDEAEELRRRHELQRSLGLEAEWMRPAQCRELEPGLSPACAAGVHAADDGEVDPGTLTAALVSAIH